MTVTIILTAFAAFMWLSIFWFIPSEETPYEKGVRRMHDKNRIDRRRWRNEGLRRVMNAEYREGIEGYREYLKDKY